MDIQMTCSNNFKADDTMDIAFVLDQSGSIIDKNYFRADGNYTSEELEKYHKPYKEYLKQVENFIEENVKNDSRVSITLFSSDVKLYLPFTKRDTAKNKATVDAAITKIKDTKPKGTTNITG